MAKKLDPTPAYVRPNSVHPDFLAGRQYTLVSPPRAIALGDPDVLPGRGSRITDWNDTQRSSEADEGREEHGSPQDMERTV